MRIATPFLLLATISLVGPPIHGQGAQGQLDSPGLKYVKFGRSFFRSHRGRVIGHWYEKYWNSNSEKHGEMHTEIHQGFRFEFIRGDRYTKDEFASLVVSDPRIALPLGIKVGDTKERIQQVFGKPDLEQDETTTYELSHDMAFLTFRFRRGRLVEMEISIDHE